MKFTYANNRLRLMMRAAVLAVLMATLREPDAVIAAPAVAPAAQESKPAGLSDEEWEKVKAKRPLPFDNGPGTIDVSGYTPAMQGVYNDQFIKTCSKCHTIARPINAPYALPAEWSTYIKKMMKKPGSGISPDAAKKIYEFLVYDSGIRKKDAIARKLREQGSAPR